jgi:hypothetical protein|nr:MAG TPA: hypothetical protein [Bacteriophage sp.]
MRLIDADKLMGELHEALKGDCDLRKDYEFMGIDEFIENQPTAYDVDKVIEEIEEWTARINVINDNSGKVGQVDVIGSNKAIKIVEGGGVSGDN